MYYSSWFSLILVKTHVAVLTHCLSVARNVLCAQAEQIYLFPLFSEVHACAALIITFLLYCMLLLWHDLIQSYNRQLSAQLNQYPRHSKFSKGLYQGNLGLGVTF